MQISTRDQRKRLRVAPTNASRRDMPTRRRLAQPERLDTVREQRGVAEIEKQLALIELGQIRKELGRDLIPLAHDVREPRQELIVSQCLQTISMLHSTALTRTFWSP
ncbi:MAG: hypothetical protein ABUL62_14160 [Myxococcales bacterium]